jgi:hypothetical protein
VPLAAGAESSVLAFSSPLAALARRGAFAGASVASAAWKIGTGIAAARLRVFGAASVSVAGATTDTSTVSLPALALLFLTARLRGDFGSIAITVKSSSPIKILTCSGSSLLEQILLSTPLWVRYPKLPT